ncbi:hypothetical protein G9464_04915 [Halostella sp. JP-L12]|uniref:hypothetical protein n=1 Tax=Halostella TaxID=1843185 RepID=UPI000EF84AB4|nr:MULTISPECIES: hypothetical protein [Halostella]NHN46937.1 hypothetical protein [Halostella sp. JP-L12]
MADTDDERTYRGLPGAFPYAFRTSDSWAFRGYAVLSALLTVLVTLLLGSALVVLIGDTVGTAGGSLTLSRSFYVLVGLLVVVPVVAPVLLVARRHRRAGSDARYDRRLALAGFGFVLALYVGLVITVPPAQQTAASGPLAPVVDALYALPPLVGLLPPILAALVIALMHRRSR